MTGPKRYESYKDTGVYWLGSVPSTWTITRLGRVTRLTTGWTPPTGDASSYLGDNLWANISDLGPKHLLHTAKSISDDAVSAARIKPSPAGSLLFSFKLSVGQVSFAGTDMYTNEAIATFQETPQLDLSYAYYALPIFLLQNANTNIYGARLLNQDLMTSAPICLPNKREQQIIARYLDKETAQIDKLIAKQERLIELLTEKRQAIIAQAVTKGLDPATPIIPSGIPWLGNIPAHWSLHRVSWLFDTISSGTTPPSESSDYYGGETNWVTTGELREKPIVSTAKKVTQKALSNFSTLRVYPPGTILMAMYGATIGRLGVLAAPATVNQACCALASPRGVVDKFVFYALLAAKEHLIIMASGGGQPNINQDKVRSLRLAVPPTEEQEAIVEMLDRDLNKLDTLVRHAQHAIELLKERRSALISAAVTGKIDVREGAV